MIISFSGLDGSGKSTQIEELIKRLEADGRKVKFVWARGGYTPGFEFIKKNIRRILGKQLPPPGNSNMREKKLRLPLIQRIWLLVAIMDLALLWGLYVRILSSLGTIVICDRYLNDTLLDFRRNFPTSNIEDRIFWKLLTGLTPVPKYSFLFWVPVETSIKRSLAKAEPFPDSRKTLEWRLDAYMDELDFPLNKYTRIDGRGSIDNIAHQLYLLIKSDANLR
jgi:thymidylate kinase